MKYPTIGLIAMFLRSLAETLEKNNAEGQPEGLPDPAPKAEAAEQPKRIRRTKEQIAADEAAAKHEAEQQRIIQEAADRLKAAEEADKGKTAEPEKPAAPAVDLEALYQERRKSFEELVKAGRGADVKALIAKYAPSGNRDIKPEDHAAFLADVEALKL